MTYSPEYIAKLVGAIVVVLGAILPLFHVNIVDEQLGQVVTAVVTLAVLVYSLFKQKQQENLTAFGGRKP